MADQQPCPQQHEVDQGMARERQENGRPNGRNSIGNDEVREGDATTLKMPADGGENTEKAEKVGVTPQKEPSMLKKAWAKLGITPPLLMMMLKGSIAPAIGVAFYQADSVARTFATLGYLVPIISILSISIMPRAKFFQTLILNVLGVCIGSAIGLLGIWSGIEARKHATPPGSTALYNSSQSAVCAIWLFANIYISNCMRAKFPALQIPVIMYSIFTNISFTYGPNFASMKQGEVLIKQILIAFLTAFALSTGVNLFVFPFTSRTVVLKEFEGYLGVVRGALKAQVAYIESLESSDMFSSSASGDQAAANADATKQQGKKKKSKHRANEQPNRTETPESKALKGAVAALKGLHGKIYGDLPFAKREVVWGKLQPEDLGQIFILFRGILVPLIGMSTITDIFERVAERRGWTDDPDTQSVKGESFERSSDTDKDKEKELWNVIMKTLHKPFAAATAVMDEGLEHAGLALELIKAPKKAKRDDVESKGTGSKPGDPAFGKYLDEKLKELYDSRGQTLKAWAREKGFPEDYFDTSKEPSPGHHLIPDELERSRDQQQLYLILYMEFLLHSIGQAVLDLVKFADKKVEDGCMKKNRLIFPSFRRLRKWVMSIGKEDTSLDNESPDSLESGGRNIFLGAGFNPKKDPEHLPPQTAWQHFGNGIRVIPRFLGSPESAFGFRAACATLTIGIVAYLKDTALFFVKNRLVWAMIIIAIGMTPSAGRSMFGLMGRMVGTALSMVISIVIWYIVDKKTPGVIVMLWFFIFLEMYFFLKFPRFLPIWLVCMVTQVLIVGYELQVVKIGIVASERTGQPWYPIYKLAPYRLACVAGGSFVSFIWTIFPYPISDRSWLRRDLGSTLYLLANYHAVVHSTIKARIHDVEGDMELKTSPGRRLEKVRFKIFGKLLMLLPSLQEHAEFEKWEPTIGGKFPRATYENIILRATNIMNYLSLIIYATKSLSNERGSGCPTTIPANRQTWIKELSSLMRRVGPTSHSVTSVLSMLSASVKQGSALPPYIQHPEPFNLTKRLEALNSGILDARHVEELGYSAYAVMQVASSLVSDDLERLVDDVRDLVGETDFSFMVNDSNSSVDSTGSETGDIKGKRD
ncbi:Uncharacterized protein BP5553_04277 [Venustampulla echinocandica]|uniref:ER transporter 6TM N-terminal domain-containing protein n=1 Tax=Venustampulla echinocandica TaxID=2656787 RepID=A0A370TWN6_9HELO|nr:Uncharacterized protein BP5553_04277 [Venustampulla echinocandica]RDL39937.1 Uncharacterized protein BP5553_04277 [Venustampulla echinocandica]